MTHSLALALFFFSVLFLSLPAFADLGPKPSATIDVTFADAKIAEPFEAKLLACIPRENAQAASFDEQLPANFRIREFDAGRDCFWEPAEMAWGGHCVDSRCEFNYMVPQEFKVAAFLPGKQKVFVSEPVTRQNFNAEFVMNIPENGMASLAESTALLQQDTVIPFFLSLFITLALEALGTLFFFWRVSMPFNRRLLALVGAANLLSLPVVWFVFPRFGLEPLVNLLFSEAFAVLFEAAFLFHAARPLLTGKRALALSLLNNALSLFVGGLLFILLAAALGWPLY